MLYASGVGIPSNLDVSLRGIGKAGAQGIQDAYAPLAARQQAEAGVRGLRPGTNSYGPQRLGVQQGLDTSSMQAAFNNQLGDTAYKNQLAERDYGQQRQLAEETASLNKPSILEQILSGIGSAGKVAGTYYGMKGKSAPGAGYATASGPGTAYNIMNPGPMDLGYGGF